MSFRALLYWADRAWKGDRRPLYFLAGWLVLIGTTAALLLLT